MIPGAILVAELPRRLELEEHFLCKALTIEIRRKIVHNVVMRFFLVIQCNFQVYLQEK
jgi:hypothetical protein